MPAENLAKQLTAGTKDLNQKYQMITAWVSRNIAYDFVKAAKVAKIKNVAPDPAACWATHRGICQDIASVVTIMLRAVGVRSYMCVGHAGNAYHAWVQAYAGSRVYVYDHDKPAGKDIKYRIEKVY